MRDIWLISDTHFFHENIIGYSQRPFHTAREMNECILENWNRKVKPGDIVYHLGDVYMGAPSGELVHHFLGQLHGRKRLVLGNHDNGKDKLLGMHFQKIVLWRMFREYGLLLTHVPVHTNTIKAGPKGRMINVHGHTHTQPDEGPDYRNICVEKTNYAPINLDELRIR